MSDGLRARTPRHMGSKRWIEVRIKNPLQLFDVRDPSPFRERDLDDDFVEYVVSSAREFSFSTPLKLVIYIEEPESAVLSKEAIREAVHSYFSYQIEIQGGELKRFLRRAQMFLLIGILILGACVGTAQGISVNASGPLGILREGLIIFGWVSVWKPIELVLFDWYPLYEKLRMSKKLLMTEIEVRFASTKGS